MTTPTSMEPRPAMRNSRSWSVANRASARLTPSGLTNGAMPSNTRNRPSAASRSVKFTARPGYGSAPRRGRLRRILQVLEEFSVGRQHQQIAILAQRVVVGLQTAVEAVELRILLVGARVDHRGRRVAL